MVNHAIHVGRRRILQALLDVAMTIFFRIQLRRIGRQGLDDNFRMIREIGFGLATGVNRRAIPNQDEALG